MLDREGSLLMLLMAILIFVFGGAEYLAIMLIAFAFAILVTRYEHSIKRELGIYEHERSWENVLSNGLVPTLLAVFSFTLGPLPYIGAIAAVCADKFGSELGVLAGRAYALPFFKLVPSGPSGAVSGLGLWMTLVGGLVVGVAAIPLFSVTPLLALLIGGIGFLGALVDSLFGILEERGLGTKATTNLLCSLSGGVAAYFLISF